MKHSDQASIPWGVNLWLLFSSPSPFSLKPLFTRAVSEATHWACGRLRRCGNDTIISARSSNRGCYFHPVYIRCEGTVHIYRSRTGWNWGLWFLGDHFSGFRFSISHLGVSHSLLLDGSFLGRVWAGFNVTHRTFICTRPAYISTTYWIAR